jgi:iron complex outermembrane receptor protein
MRKWQVLIILLFTGFQFIYAQSPVSGTIRDAKTGTPLPGTSVKIKGKRAGTVTDEKGNFTLPLKAGDVIQISSVGFKTIEYTVSGSGPIELGLDAALAELGELTYVGSRGAPRSKASSPVPIDVVKIDKLSIATAAPNLETQLTMAVPSFNYNKQSGGDGSDAIDFASLRGLGFDQTLVLINGKRRHMSAFVNQVGTRGRGNSGYDLNSIPEDAIDRVEVLRDGASAQYGSDAIAGVINIILKRDVNKLSINTGYMGYYDQKYNSLNAVDPSQFYTGSKVDGNTFTLGVNDGVPIGKNGGFINIGANFLASGKTFRAVPDTNVTTNSKALPPNVWRRAYGDGAVTTVGAMLNAEIPIANTSTKVYFFGGYNWKKSNVYAWTRNFSNNAKKYPTNDDGSIIFVPDIMKVAGNSDATISSDNVFYNPQENAYMKDGSFAAGITGVAAKNWNWDLSNVVGMNDFHYYGYKTFNASLLPTSLQATKTDFDDGGFSFLQNTTNLDINRHFEGIAQGLTLSFGGEFRYERYKLYAGEVDSYLNGGAYYVQGGDTTYKASGSEGYPGYTPGDEVNAHRTNVGGYVDVAIDVTKDLLLDGAARFENYSDFGFVSTYKLAARMKVGPQFNLRGSISTGFRAPSLQQINFSNTNTNIIAGQLVYVKLSPNYSVITKAAGVPQLTQETSRNYSLGFSYQPSSHFTLTVDAYLVKVFNRIVITGNFDSSIPAIAPYLVQYNVSSVNFFANAVNTTNQGIDIVADYHKSWGKKRFSVVLAGNIQSIDINKINIPTDLNDTYAHQQAFFSTREQAFLIASAPKSKFSLALEYDVNRFTTGIHITYYGKLTTEGFGSYGYPDLAGTGKQGDPDLAFNGYNPLVQKDDGTIVPENFVFNGKATTDVYASYGITKNITWFIGVNNLFNVHPDLAVVPGALNSWGDSESGGPFDSVQMGPNGFNMFTKFALRF